MNRTGKVNGAFKKLKTAQAAETLRAEPPTMPTGKFRVIVADPPWQYEKRAEDPSHRGQCPYPTMTAGDVVAMPVNDLAHDDSILWLWTTNAFMFEAYNIAAAWGFQVKTILTWVKDRMGLGDWLRGQTEHCLMCVRGKPVIQLTNQTTVLNGKLREHSRKPDEFYSLVEALCPGSKCELFCRQQRDGWTAFGAEVGRFQ
jgi:N6-adenosine-specific RNA methylase IME4